ncbi:hypothetical protein K9B32_25280 [Rhizobium sp. 3T7]|uniref:hypothetical protein n=1 Tax=Rhizobium sp. 3T7 TaxID=2874922 RepID=UPI001CC9CFFD|nr:hypothetical protein [Rhizobium sp. 3T7]MBZ9793382.1 hypothetical protein [Rhizobium sp. 3T7]
MTDHSIATIPPDQPLPDLSNMSLIPNYLTTLAGLRPEQIGQTLLYWTCIPLLVMTPIAVWALHRTDGRFVLFRGGSAPRSRSDGRLERQQFPDDDRRSRRAAV